jgi:hypothetical protein
MALFILVFLGVLCGLGGSIAFDVLGVLESWRFNFCVFDLLGG